MEKFVTYFAKADSPIVKSFLENFENCLLSCEYMIVEQSSIPSDENIKKVLTDASKKFHFDLGLVAHFSTGVGGFIGPLSKFFSNQNVTVSEQELILIAFSLLATLEKPDMKVFSIMFSSLMKGKNKLKKLMETSRKILVGIITKLKAVGNVFAFTSLMIPIMDALTKVAGGNLSAITGETIKNIIIGMAINYSIHFGGPASKKVYTQLKTKLSSKF